VSRPGQGLRWGLVGASDIAATSLIPAIRAQAGSEVAAVYSRSKSRGEEYARRWGIQRSHDDLQGLLHDSIDAVYVSTTNERHCAETIAAAAAGKHVLCEKPLALTLDDAVDMVKACRRAGVVLATNHGRRNDAALRVARDVVRSGRLGRLLSARTSNCIELPEHLRRWRLSDAAAGAGAVLDMVVHEADTLRFVLDEEPVEVTAMTGWHGMSSGDVEDAVMGVLRTDSGLLASYSCSFAVPHGVVALELDGSAASLFVQRRPPSVVLRGPDGVEELPVAGGEPIGQATVRAFEAAVHGEGRPTASGEDGLRALAVALATLESARDRRTVVLDAQTDV
jgi:1,5-anhydro-D-fructose reductase (1,5-anhydro-D-mannitol-forming)